MKRLVILGAGTAGTMMAHKLRRELDPRHWSITVIDRDDEHIYQPGLLLLPFGTYKERELVRPRTQVMPSDVTLKLTGFSQLDVAGRTVVLGDGSREPFDVLIIATGTRIDPGATEGLADMGWHRSAFDFYTLEGASQLRRHLADFEGGRVVIHTADMPIKCPVAPLEFAFLADAFFTERGLRDKVELVYATPLDGAFTKPLAAQALGDLLVRRGIHVETDFAVERVDGEQCKLSAYDGREVDYDLLVTIPLHFGTEALGTSGLVDEMGFVRTDKHSLAVQGDAADVHGIFALGDGTNLPTSKAGSVAHFQAEVLIDNVLRHLEGLEPEPAFDGHANCFIETGHGKALLIDFNYDTEPLPGRFPLPGVGPFTLLGESRMNHWGKLGFKWVYWNLLLEGRELPIDHRLVMAGKRRAA